MRPSDVSQLLTRTAPEGLPILLVGAPGVGKTSLVQQAADNLGYQLLISHPVVADPTDAKGLPWPDASTGTARFLPFGELAQAIAATEPTIWLLDDLGQAPAAVQASYMQLILGRKLNGHQLPDCVSFVAATNRRQDRAGVSGILSPVKSRFAAIVPVDADLDDYIGWALSQTFYAPEQVAFHRMRPDLLLSEEPSADIANVPSPRTWAHLARLHSLNLPENLRLSAYAGAVGEGPAVEFLAFLGMYRSIVSVDRILMDAANAPIPAKPGELYAVMSGLAFRANDSTFDRIGTYLRRVADNGHGEFAVLCARDSIRRTPAVEFSTGWVSLMSTPVGALIMGTAR